MTPDFAEYLLPAGLGRVEAEAGLAAHLRVQGGAAETLERTYYDTFDGRLHAAGLSFAEDADGLVALNGVGELARAPASRRPAGRGIFTAELPEGGLRELLAPVVEMRALVSLVRVRSRQRTLRVLDDEAKTVVRLVVVEPELLPDDGAALRLDARVQVRGVRGYGDAFARVCRVLERELELRAARSSLLDDAVVASGRPAAGVSSRLELALRPDERADRAAAALLLHLAATIDRNLPGVLDDTDTEFVHDFRVAVRRTRSAQRQLLPVFPPEPIARFRAEFRWLQQVTGPTRDLDVHLLEFDGLAAALPESERLRLEPLRRLLRARRAAERRRMVRALRSPWFEALLSEWPAFLHGLVESPADGRPEARRPIAEVAGGRIGTVYRRMVKAGGSIHDGSPARELHDLRKTGKELRYLLEFFASLYPAEVVRPMVGTLKGLQDTLGRFYDREMQAAALRSLGPEVARLPDGAGTLMAMGALVAWLDADQAGARLEFGARFAAFASKRQRSLVRATFA
jgi:CHAD domain-containing protein